MKIEVKDLRIGNFVEMECDGKKFNTKIDIGDFMDINRGYKIVFGILLTEEILFRCGFVSDEVNGSFETFENGLKFTIIDKCEVWMVYLSGKFGMIVLKHIKFVHEIQNLFNSLTGQELNTSGLI